MMRKQAQLKPLYVTPGLLRRTCTVQKQSACIMLKVIS